MKAANPGNCMLSSVTKTLGISEKYWASKYSGSLIVSPLNLANVGDLSNYGYTR